MRLLMLGALLGTAAAQPCGGPVAGAAIGTLLVLLALQVAGYLLWKAYWKGKTGQHLVLVTDPEKGESVYAFDNPGFKEGPPALQGAEEKESQKLKWTNWNSIGLVSTNNPTKIKSMDDSFTAQPTLNVVPLRSHDFTGLGFNICGNMRDGIFVKDVLHRGPASESGRIMPGDRIDSVKISLRHMVLEDALTILSYASPYEVELSVETRAGNTGSLLRTPPPPHRICHPFYRSHSISDLHQIGKSNTKRLADQPNSLVSDLSGSEGGKPSTLDRKPKPVEPEKHQNTRNCIIESVQKQENVFHTIELDRDEPDLTKTKEASPSNVKSLLVKGIQNLKEKLHHSLHQEDTISRDESKNDSRHSTLDKKKDDGFKSVELTVPEEVQRAGAMARSNRKSLVEDIVADESEDPVAAKRKKGKAPMPPQTRDDAETGSLGSGDSDSDSGGDKSGTTIELNSSHITVHHSPEGSESRKASSLGDLSRYEGERVAVLERAVSLDLGDGPGGKKRKAPAPPDPALPTTPDEEHPTLKKSSVWGTLQDAINSDSETDLGISGCSTPEKMTTNGSNFYFDLNDDEPVTSTPFKVNEHLSLSSFKIGEPLTSFNIGESVSHTAFGEHPSTTHFKINETANPSLFKTVTFSTDVKGNDDDEDDSPYRGKEEPVNDFNCSKVEEVVTLSPSREAVSSCSWDMTSDFVTAVNGDDTPPELPTSPVPTLDSYITEIQVTTPGPRPSDYVRLDGAEQLMDHINIYKFESSNEGEDAFRSETVVSVEPVKEADMERSPPPPRPDKPEIVKPARSNVSVTNFKSTPSRIPVRAAGPRSPTTSLSPPSDKRNFTHRNGHGSP